MRPFKDKRSKRQAEVVRVWLANDDFEDIVGESVASLKLTPKGWHTYEVIMYQKGDFTITRTKTTTINLNQVVKARNMTIFKEYIDS